MKLNFKRIASVLASTIMLSSTVAIAAATTFPAPFVTGGNADVAIVYGAAAAPTDLVAATDIQNNLNGKVTAQTVPGASSTVSGGDFVKLEKTNTKINLGDALNSVYTKIDADQLKTVLTDGTYTDDDGTDYDYEQSITFGASTLTHFSNSDVNADETPVIGFDIAANANLLNYSLDFTDTPKNSSALLKTTTIDMLGREYYISDVDATTANLKVTLLDTANSVTVNEGETATVNVGSASYEVKIVSVDSTAPGKATLEVNGKKLDAISVGNSKKIATDTYISVKDVYEGKRERDVSYVEFSIGSGQIIMQNGEKVEINEDTIDDLTSYLTVSAGELSKITLQWTPEDESFLVPGKELVLPGFGTIKLAMAGFERPTESKIKVSNSGDDYMQLQDLEVKDGSISSLPFLATNKTNILGAGKESDKYLLETSTGLTGIIINETEKSRIVATDINGDEGETYIFELSSVTEGDNSAKNETKLRNLASGETFTFSSNDWTAGDDKDFGDLNIKVYNMNGDAGTAKVDITATSGTAYADRIVTTSGLTIFLPVNTVVDSPTRSNILNATALPTSWNMNFTEANKDGDIAVGTPFRLPLAFATDGIKVSEPTTPEMIATDSNSDDKEGYVVSELASKILWKGSQDQPSVEISYPSGESYAEVVVSEAAVTISSNGTTSTSVMVVKDSEASSVSSKNLIVVGGSCINTVAAELVGATYPACGADWQTKTGVGAGSYLIQTFSRTGGKVATLVAGYNAPDTTNAANALIANTNVDTSVGKKYTGSVGTTISLVTS